MRKEMENPKKCNDLDSSCCKVCGEKANNFVAYGGKSCGCCRQFFRRTVVKMSRQDKIPPNNHIEDNYLKFCTMNWDIK